MALSTGRNESEGIAGDRRFDRRYGLQLELRWKLIGRRKVQNAGAGRTIDLSSGGVLFDAALSLPVGFNVELLISWPVLLHDIAPMQLVLSGRIMRSSGPHVAVQITEHEFRTAAIPADHRQVLATAARAPGLVMHAGFSAFANLGAEAVMSDRLLRTHWAS